MPSDGPTFLNDVWTLYFHDPDDTNWNTNSYMRIGDISTVEDMWDHHAATSKYLTRGMFFLMREHVYPCWDDPHNIKGGCLSMKVLKDAMPACWEHFLVRMLGETLLVTPPGAAPDAWSVINGISVSPKKLFCIVKLWLRTEDYTDRRFFDLPSSYDGEVLYKNNADNITGNNYVLQDATASMTKPETVCEPACC
jgi:hypothetical protein